MAYWCAYVKRVFVLLLIVLLLTNFCESNPNLMDRYNEILRNFETRWMIIDLLETVMSNINCYVMMVDSYYYEIIGNLRLQHSKPYFKILVNESEDLLSPNYETIKVVQEAKKNGCNFYVIFLTNGEQVARFFTFGDRYRTIDSRARFVILKDRRMFAQKYSVLWKKMVNVLFVKQYKNAHRFELSTVPFPPPLNGQVIPYKINVWDNGFQKNKALFHDKTSNLKGQTLKVVTFEHVPTTTIITTGNYSKDEESTFVYAGLEIEVLKTLASAMNFHYTIFEPANAEEEQWGRRQTNGSFSGLLGEMAEGKADIALGNLYYTPYHLEMLDLSVPYNTECLTFLTPESLTDNSWQTLVLPFQGNMWIAVIITLFLGGFMCYIFASYHRYIECKNFNIESGSKKFLKIRELLREHLKPLKTKITFYWKKLHRKQEFLCKSKEAYVRKRHIISSIREPTLAQAFVSEEAEEAPHEGLYVFEALDNSILYTYGMFLQISLPKMPTGWSIRMFTGWWWLYCILVSVSYKASMTAILANPAPRVTIDTLEQLAESDVKCGGWGEQSKAFFVTSLDVTSQKVGTKFEITYDVDSAVERVASGDFAYYENIYFLHYLTVKHKDINLLNRLISNDTEDEKSIDKTKGKILHVMSSCVINMPISIGLQKNSPLKPKIDEHLARVIEAGLVIKWLNDVMFKIRNTEAKQDTDEVKALMNLKKLYGAVAALWAGYVISIVVLIVELIMWYCVEKKRPHFDKYNLREYYAKQKSNQ